MPATRSTPAPERQPGVADEPSGALNTQPASKFRLSVQYVHYLIFP